MKHDPILPNNCPINEQTADGVIVGRCFYYLPDGRTCPRHGNVEAAVQHYHATGKLTLVKREESSR